MAAAATRGCDCYGYDRNYGCGHSYYTSPNRTVSCQENRGAGCWRMLQNDKAIILLYVLQMLLDNAVVNLRKKIVKIHFYNREAKS